LYISLSLGLLVSLRHYWSEESYRLNVTIPLLVIFTLWINDTMAYIVGSAIGKTPLSAISPKKTWEGTVGGILLAVLVLCAVAYYTGRLSLLHTAVITTLAAVSGTFGDLFESKLKRLACVKDSGSFMPGHGGFLDRFDSLLFASTVVWFYAVFFYPVSIYLYASVTLSIAGAFFRRQYYKKTVSVIIFAPCRNL
jgi:phosphatidate cytidylyltransferase